MLKSNILPPPTHTTVNEIRSYLNEKIKKEYMCIIFAAFITVNNYEYLHALMKFAQEVQNAGILAILFDIIKSLCKLFGYVYVHSTHVNIVIYSYVYVYI